MNESVIAPVFALTLCVAMRGAREDCAWRTFLAGI
jgi:hypothetical protein